MEDTPKPGRFYFDRDQLVLIVLGYILSAAIILVLGMITGKMIARRSSAERTASVRIPVSPAPADGEATMQAAPEAPAGQAPEANVEPPQRSAKSQSAQPALKQPGERTEEPKEKRAEKAAPAPTREQRRAPAEPGDQIWTVQVKSSPDRAFAERWVEQLKNKGHDAYIVDADVSGQTWYRVRVGQLKSRQEAETFQRELEAQERLSGTLLLRANR